MKNYYFLSLFVLLFFQGFGQEKNNLVSSEHTITRALHLDLNKVYNKETGQKMSPEEVEKLLWNNSNLRLEPFFGDDGKVSRFYYYPDASSGEGIFSTETIEEGKPFPDFSMRTTEGEKVRLKNLKGKLVVLHFALDAMRFRYDELEKLDAQVNTLVPKGNVKALVVLGSRESNLAPQFDSANSNFSLVNEGSGFIEKFGLRWVPSTIVIDGDGKLIGIFKSVDDIDLNSYL